MDFKNKYNWEKPFNYEEFISGKPFVIVNNLTKKKYVIPKIKPIIMSVGSISNITDVIGFNLLEEDFIEWAVCTTKDFFKCLNNDFVIRYFNYKRRKTIVFNFEYPEIFQNNYLTDPFNDDLWNIAFERNKAVEKYMPASIKINNLGKLKNIDFNIDLLHKLRVPSAFHEIYFNSDDEHKIKIFKVLEEYEKMYKVTSRRWLIDQEVADYAFNLDVNAIKLIPPIYIKKEQATRAMDVQILLLKYVMPKYQTEEYQKKLIDKDPTLISLISPEALTDNIICYALDKDNTVLERVKKTRINYYVANYAINKNPNALKIIPDKLKTKEMCLKAVSQNSELIKYVPVKFVDSDFIDKLNQINVTIPKDQEKFVEECLRIHQENKSENIRAYEESDYLYLNLRDLPGLLSEPSLKYLEGKEITTVGELLQESLHEEFYEIILEENKQNYVDLTMSIKLLKCKYLDVDPLVDLDPNQSLKDFISNFGFTARLNNVILRNLHSPEEFLKLLNEDESEQDRKFIRFRNMGVKTKQELLFKTSIILNYYNRHKDVFISEQTDEEKLKDLKIKKDQLEKEIERLNSELDMVLDEIKKINQKGAIIK